MKNTEVSYPKWISRSSQKYHTHAAQCIDDCSYCLEQLDAIAFTQGPGLIGSLIVGAAFAKSLALSLQKPLITVHHMHAHIMSHWIDAPKPAFPFLCMTISGGHTQLVRVDAPLQFTILGQTIDDAAGEAFDKGAKLLQLPYPGGPLIDRLAAQGDPHKYKFPISNIEGYDFSFRVSKPPYSIS